jgi:hypothetical protein
LVELGELAAVLTLSVEEAVEEVRVLVLLAVQVDHQ